MRNILHIFSHSVYEPGLLSVGGSYTLVRDAPQTALLSLAHATLWITQQHFYPLYHVSLGTSVIEFFGLKKHNVTIAVFILPELFFVVFR